MSDAELAHELLSLDEPSGREVGDDWQPVRVCECGDRFVPEWAHQIRCTFCTAVKQGVDL